MRDLYTVLVAAVVLMAVITMGIGIDSQAKTIIRLEEKIIRDSLMHVMRDDIDSARVRWRNRCYLAAMERSINPEEVCDDGK